MLFAPTPTLKFINPPLFRYAVNSMPEHPVPSHA